MEINELVQASKKGDMESFIQLIKIKENLIYRIARVYTYNSQDAEDSISDATIRAFERVRQLRTPEKFYPWYISILVNVCRKKYKANIRETEYIPDKHDGSIEEIMQHSDNSILIENILNHLKDNERDIIVLRYLKDFTLEEMAAILEIPVGTVKSKISRIIDKIKCKYGRLFIHEL